MLVKLLIPALVGAKHHAPGDTVDLDRDRAAELVRLGHAAPMGAAAVAEAEDLVGPRPAEAAAEPAAEAPAAKPAPAGPKAAKRRRAAAPAPAPTPEPEADAAPEAEAEDAPEATPEG